jgi:hypothetical protein
MDAQRIAVDAVVALTDCDREQVTAFIRKLYLAGVKDPKRLTFKGLQAIHGTDSPPRLKPRTGSGAFIFPVVAGSPIRACRP